MDPRASEMVCQSPNLPKPAAFTKNVTRGSSAESVVRMFAMSASLGEVGGYRAGGSVQLAGHVCQGLLVARNKPQLVGHLLRI